MDKEKFVIALCRKEKYCSIKKAMKFAEDSAYHSELVRIIIERKDCSFPYLWELLQKTGDIPWVISSATRNDSFKHISYEQFLLLFVASRKQDSNYHDYIDRALVIAAERKVINKFSGEQLLDFSRRFAYKWPVISQLGRKNYWKKMSKEAAFKILQDATVNHRHNDYLAQIFISRKDCSLQEALEILKHSKTSLYVFSAIIKRNDFKLSDILSNLKKATVNNMIGDYSPDDIIVHNFDKIIARSDCSLKLAYELLEKVRQDSYEYGFGLSVSAFAALIKRGDLSLDKAFSLMEEIECHRDAIAAFEKRADFDLKTRIRLTQMMSRLIPDIYERGDEPEFNDSDITKIISNGDWINLPLREALRLCKNWASYSIPLQIISQRKDWTELSLEQAIELAAENGNQTHILELIITEKNCPLDKALKLAKSRKGDDNLYDDELARVIIKSEISSCEESLQILEKSDNPMFTAVRVAERKDTPLLVIIELLENTNYQSFNLLDAANKHEDWKTISLDDAFNFLPKATSYFGAALAVITEREDWRKLSFKEAINFLSKINWHLHSWRIVWSLTEKKDCPLEMARQFLGLLDSSDISSQRATLPVVARLDNPLEDALELAKNSYYGSFAGIVMRQDWQELPLALVCQYIEKYSNLDLINSLAERDDWKKMTFEESLKQLTGFRDGCYERRLYLGLIIRNESHPLSKVLELLEAHNYDHLLASEFIKRKDCPLDLVSDVFKKTDMSAFMFRAMSDIDDWKELSLEEAFSFAKKTSSGLYDLITKRDDWKTLSLRESLKLAEKHAYSGCIIKSIANHKDWLEKN